MPKLPRVYIALGVFVICYAIIWTIFQSREKPSLNLGSRPRSEVEKLDAKGIAKAPEISIVQNGTKVSLSQYKGKVVLLDFWATWCGPCRTSIPAVVGLYEKYKDRGFQVIGPALERDTGEQVPQAAIAYGITYPVGMPVSKEEVEVYGAMSIPCMVLVDKKGTIRWSQNGYNSETEARLDGYIQQLLAES